MALPRTEEYWAVVSLPGYEDQLVELKRVYDLGGGSSLGNFLLGGPIGMVIGGTVDGASGANYSIKPEQVELVMEKK